MSLLARLTAPFRLATRRPARPPRKVGYWSYTIRTLFDPPAAEAEDERRITPPAASRTDPPPSGRR